MNVNIFEMSKILYQYIFILLGVHWIKKDNYFYKSIMAPGCSFEALQWLTFIQENDHRLVNKSGKRVKLQHKYFRGEKRVDEWDVDGYAEVDGQKYFYEYLGCFFHKGCPKCGNPMESDERFERKRLELSQQGTVITMRGCDWKKQVTKLRSKPSPSFPKVYENFSTEKKILDGIEKDELFGFIVADVTTPPDVLEKILPLNFPPVIHRAEIDETMVSEYMKGRCDAKDRKLPQETLVQTYHGKQLMIYTPTVQFYMELGLEISNVTKFIQYLPTKPLNNFVKKITKGRIDAVESGNESLGTAYKIIGNS